MAITANRGFPLGLTSGDWRSSVPEPGDNVREEFRLVKLSHPTLPTRFTLNQSPRWALKRME